MTNHIYRHKGSLRILPPDVSKNERRAGKNLPEVSKNEKTGPVQARHRFSAVILFICYYDLLNMQ